MASVPSIKGSVFATVVEGVAKLVARGEASGEELSRWLEPADVALLDQEILVSGWYDIRIYDRMNALLLDLEGGGDTEYYREQGRVTARRLLEAGFYAQFEYLHRAEVTRQTSPRARFEAFGRDLRLLTSLSGSILNFSRWKARPDPQREHRYVIEVSEASAMPDSLCWRSDGLINEMAAVHGQPDLWTWDRPHLDLVVFHMLRAA
jgi:hypothetical protein